jgi:tetratricopeptide (TPR) repeat protein
MSRVTIAFFCLMAVVLIAPTSWAVPEYYDQTVTDEIERIERQVMIDSFAAADSICRELIRSHPDDPAGYFFRAVGLLAEMVDRHEDLYPSLYPATLDSVDATVNRLIDTCGPDILPWCYLFRGFAKSYRALYRGEFGFSSEAYKLGKAAVEDYKSCLALDGAPYDAYLGLGSFHYWKSAKAGFWRVFGIVSDEREKGIREMQLAIDSSTISKNAARKSFIAILTDHEEYDRAIALASYMLDRFPSGRAFLWGLARANYAKGDYSESLKYYERLRLQLAANPGNYYKLVECDAFIARCLSEMGRQRDARLQAIHLLAYQDDIPKTTLELQKDHVEYLRKVIGP